MCIANSEGDTPLASPTSVLAPFFTRWTPASTDGVATRSRLPRETRRLSDRHVDGVAWAWRRADAIDANLKFRKGQKQTPSQTAKSRHFLAFSTTTASR